MKQITIFFLSFFVPIFLGAQYRMGFRLELNRPNADFQTLTIPINTATLQSIQLDPKMKTGGGFGIIGQFPFLKLLFLQTEALFDFENTTYDVLETQPNGTTQDLKLKEGVIWVDVPASLGIKWVGLKAFAGGSARFAISSTSEIEKKYADYNAKYELPLYTWHYGIGLDLPLFDKAALLMVDLRAETSKDYFGSHIRYNDVTYDFGKPLQRYVLAVGITF
jgi:hypothetical protein